MENAGRFNGLRPLLVYDGECGFCRRWVEKWKVLTGVWVDFEPCQSALERFPDVPQGACFKSIHLLKPGGKRSSGAEAVFEVLAHHPRKRLPLWFYRHVPLFGLISEYFYSLVARRRELFSKLDRFFLGP